MKNKDKTREQLISELTEMRQQVADTQGRLRLLEMSEMAHRDAREQLQRRAQGMTLLNQVTTLIASAKDMAEALHNVCAELACFLHLSQAGFAILNPECTAAEVVADYHPSGSPSAIGVTIPVDGNPSMAYILEHKTPLAVAEAQTDPLLAPVHDVMRQRNVQSILLVPILVEGEVIGTLGFDTFQRRVFSQANIDLVQHVANQVGPLLMWKQAESQRDAMLEALRESEAKYRSLTDDVLDGSMIGIFILDSDYKVVWVNQALERYFGVQREEIVGKDKRQLIRERIQHIFEDPESFAGKVIATYDDNTYVENFECHVLPDDKRQGRWLEHWSQPIRSGLYTGGRIEHYADITERKRAEEELQNALEKLRTMESIINQGPVALFLWRVAPGVWPVELVSDNVEKILGYAADDFTSGRFSWPGITHPDDVPRLEAEVKRHLEEGIREWSQEYRLLTKSGDMRWMRDWNKALTDSTGEITYIQGIAVDITERKRSEDLLRAQHDLGLALGATQGLEETLRLCVEAAIRVSGLDCGGVYLVDETSGSVDLVHHQGLPSDFIASASHYDADSVNARMVIAGKPIYARYQELIVPLDEPGRREGLRAIAIVPVLHEDRAVACLNVASHTLDEVPDVARMALETTAIQIGSAIVRSRAEDALHQSQVNLQTLFDSVEDFLFVLDIKGRILRVNPVVTKRLGYSEAELLGEGVLKVHPPDRREEAAAIVADIVVGKTDSCPVPLMAKDGTQIPVETKITRGRWGDREALFGVSRDVTERVRAEKERRERERFLALLNDITRAALETPDLPTMLQTLADRAGELFGADGCYLALWDEATQTAIPASAYGEWRKAYPSLRLEPGETTMTESVLRARRPLVVEDVFDTPYLSQRIANLFPDRSLLGLPLIAGDQKLGAALIAFNEPHHFSSDEIARGEQAAGQIALAIAKARLLEETRAQWREAETLHQAGAAITQTLSLDERLERILVQLEQVVPYDSASVQLLRDDHLEIVGGRGFSEPEAVIGLKFLVSGDKLNTAVIKGRKPVLLPDAETAYESFSQPPHAHIHSWMGVPLIVRDRVIGVLAVDSAELDHFNQNHIRLVVPFANQVAVAIENARLYEETERLKVFNENIVQGVAEAILIANSEGVLTFANPAAEALLGYTREELIGLHWNALVPEDELDKVQREATKWLQGSESRYETALLGKEGRVVPGIVSARPLFEDGKFAGVLAALTDITERVRAEEALARYNRNLVMLNRAGQELTSTLNQRQIMERLLQVVTEIVSAEGASVWLWEEEQTPQPQPHKDAAQSHRDAAQRDAWQDWLVCRATSPHPQGGSPFNMRVRSDQGIVGWVARHGKSAIVPYAPDDPRFFPDIDKQTGFRTLSLLAVPLWVRSKVIGVLEAVNKLDRDFVPRQEDFAPRQWDFVPRQGHFDEKDMTLLETLAASAAIAIDNAQLIKVLGGRTMELHVRNEELNAYAHTVAHDLKGPLAHMIGFAQVLEQDYAKLPAEELPRHLRTISQSGRKMNNIIDELLLMAELREAEVELDPLDMASVVDEALGWLAYMIEERQVQIVLPENWPAALGYGPWVEEVWANYLSNAVKYSGRPPRVELGGEEQADGMVRFWVRDNGPGLTPEEQGRLFKSFERLDRVRAKGYGLGLSIVRRIVEKLGGEVGVESEVGQGSLFWFTLRRG